MHYGKRRPHREALCSPGSISGAQEKVWLHRRPPCESHRPQIQQPSVLHLPFIFSVSPQPKSPSTGLGMSFSWGQLLGSGAGTEEWKVILRQGQEKQQPTKELFFFRAALPRCVSMCKHPLLKNCCHLIIINLICVRQADLISESVSQETTKDLVFHRGKLARAASRFLKMPVWNLHPVI